MVTLAYNLRNRKDRQANAKVSPRKQFQFPNRPGVKEKEPRAKFSFNPASSP
jgi:hypothetical protein